MGSSDRKRVSYGMPYAGKRFLAIVLVDDTKGRVLLGEIANPQFLKLAKYYSPN